MASAAPLLESLGHHVDQSAPAAMFEQEFLGHFIAIIAADTEATFQAFEMLLGRPIGEDEIEPRNADHRPGRPGARRGGLPAEPGLARDVGAPDGGLVDRP